MTLQVVFVFVVLDIELSVLKSELSISWVVSNRLDVKVRQADHPELSHSKKTEWERGRERDRQTDRQREEGEQNKKRERSRDTNWQTSREIEWHIERERGRERGGGGERESLLDYGDAEWEKYKQRGKEDVPFILHNVLSSTHKEIDSSILIAALSGLRWVEVSSQTGWGMLPSPSSHSQLPK